MRDRPPDRPRAREPATWSMTVRLQSRPDALRAARRLVYAIARVAGIDELDARGLEVAVGEAVTNAYLHAYAEQTRRKIELELTCDGRALTVVVHDTGLAAAAPIAIPQQAPPPGAGGRGLYLIGKLVDRVDIIRPDRRGRGTAIRMVRHLPPPDPSV